MKASDYSEKWQTATEEDFDSTEVPLELIVMGSFSFPSTPTNNLASRLFERLKPLLKGDEESELGLANERLQRKGENELMAASRELLADWLAVLLEREYGEWLASEEPRPGASVVLYQPTMPIDAFRQWAALQGHEYLTASEALERLECEKDDTEGVLCIYDLPTLFLRETGGLDDMRKLLYRIASSKRKLLLMVNSWTWRFLAAALRIDRTIQHRRVVPACGADAVDDLLGLVHQRLDDKRRLYSTDSGVDVRERDDDDLKDPYLRILAASHYGCPWSMLNQLYSSVSELLPEEEKEDGDSESKTSGSEVEDVEDVDGADDVERLWILHQEKRQLRESLRKPAALILQSLLIHGGLDLDRLRRTLPMAFDEGMLATLLAEDWLTCEDGIYSINYMRYPLIRLELSQVGLPLDQL